MRTTLLAALLLGPVAAATPELRWEHDGYAAILDAAAEAKQKERRLLVGLAGSAG